MTREQLRAALTDVQALTCTLHGEAAGEPIQGQIAVGSVIRNRADVDLGADGRPDWWGEGIRGVCLAPAQFSCWWEKAQNTDRVYALAEALIGRQPVGPFVAELQWIAEGIVGRVLRDRTGGATHYLSTTLYRTKPPTWAKRPDGRGPAPVATVGNHTFFKLY